jgi:hypothetical protein
MTQMLEFKMLGGKKKTLKAGIKSMWGKGKHSYNEWKIKYQQKNRNCKVEQNGN